MCKENYLFASFVEIKDKTMLAANNFIESTGRGTVIIRTGDSVLILKHVLYVPSLQMIFFLWAKQ